LAIAATLKGGRSEKMPRFVEPSPRDAEALRHNGIASIREVHAAVLENDGKISVIEKR
jgi:hypothetical protein